MTRHQVIRTYLHQLRFFPAAPLPTVGTPILEGAALGNVQGAGSFALDALDFLSLLHMDGEQRTEQRLGIGMKRAPCHLLPRNHLHNMSQIHNRNLVREGLNQRQIVADEHDADLLFPLQPNQELDDGLLNGHIQGAGGLVANQDFRLQRQRPGNADALPLSARHAVGIPVDKILRQLHHTQ